jgi:hypothetical protein
MLKIRALFIFSFRGGGGGGLEWSSFNKDDILAWTLQYSLTVCIGESMQDILLIYSFHFLGQDFIRLDEGFYAHTFLAQVRKYRSTELSTSGIVCCYNDFEKLNKN